MKSSFTRPFRLTLLLTFALLIAGCLPVTQSVSPTGTAPITATNSPSPTPAPTLSPTPTATVTPSRSGGFIGTFGAGYFSGIFHSPDGKRIFVPINGKELRWYDAKTLQQEGSMVLSDYQFLANEVIFAPDPNLVAVVGFTTFVIDLKNQKILASISGTETYLSGLQFSSDTQFLFYRRHETYNHGFSDNVSSWDIEQDRLAHSYWESEFLPELYHNASISNPTISPDGKRIAVGYDKLLQIRDVQTAELLQSFKGHTSRITSVSFNSDGSKLASVDIDGVVQLWDSQTGQKLRKFSLKLETQVLKLSFLEDDKQLIATCDDSSQQTIDLKTGWIQGPMMPTIDPLAMILHQQGYSQFDYSEVALTISPDGKTLAVGSETVLLWDIQTQKIIGVLENSANVSLLELQFDPTGRLLAGITHYQTLLWDTTASTQPNLAKVFGPLVDPYWRKGLSFSPNGKYIAVGGSSDVEIWDVETAQKIKTLRASGNPRFVDDTQFLEDGHSLFSVVEMERAENATGVNSQAQIWDIETGQLTRSIDLFGNSPYSSAFRWPFFAFQNIENNQKYWVEIWNLETKTSKKIDGWLGPTFFSKNSNLLFGVTGGQFSIWQVETGKLIYTSSELEHDPVYLKYSLDLLHASNFVATYGYMYGIVQLYDISAIIDEAYKP